MATDVYISVTDCRKCAPNGANKAHMRHLKLSPDSGPFEFIALDKLHPLRKTTSGNQFVVIMTDRYSTLTQAVLILKTSTTQIASIFYAH